MKGDDQSFGAVHAYIFTVLAYNDIWLYDIRVLSSDRNIITEVLYWWRDWYLTGFNSYIMNKTIIHFCSSCNSLCWVIRAISDWLS